MFGARSDYQLASIFVAQLRKRMYFGFLQDDAGRLIPSSPSIRRALRIRDTILGSEQSVDQPRSLQKPGRIITQGTVASKTVRWSIRTVTIGPPAWVSLTASIRRRHPAPGIQLHSLQSRLAAPAPVADRLKSCRARQPGRMRRTSAFISRPKTAIRRSHCATGWNPRSRIWRTFPRHARRLRALVLSRSNLRDTVIHVGYVGNKSTNLVTIADFNQSGRSRERNTGHQPTPLAPALASGTAAPSRGRTQAFYNAPRPRKKGHSQLVRLR